LGHPVCKGFGSGLTFLQFIPVRSHDAENLADVSSSFCMTMESRCRTADDKRTTTRRTWMNTAQDYTR